MLVVILAVYSDNQQALTRIKRDMEHVAAGYTQYYETGVEAVIVEMESSVQQLEANLRQLKG